MPKVYLSPAYHYSNNCYFNNCYEAKHNNEYIDILEPILNRCKIETKRGPRRIPLSNENGEDLMWQAIRESNAWKPDVHYVSHTNASPKHNARGYRPMYYGFSSKGKKLANIMVKWRKTIYPYAIKMSANYKLHELKDTDAVAFYEEHVFHDDYQDAKWFHEHMKDIAEVTAKGLCEYFGIPYIPEKKPTPAKPTYVTTVKFPLLKKGSTDVKVKVLQALLIGQGYNCGGYGIDGDFGSGTYESVKKYQKDKKLSVDGEVGKDTWSKLLYE